MLIDEIARYGRKVRLVEVGPRDGLQNASRTLSVEARVELVQSLVKAGHRDIEVGAFVHPKWVPQMADTGEVVRALEPVEGVHYWALVPNMTGLENALDAGLRHAAVFLSASETHNQRNLNRSISESRENVRQIAARCDEEGIHIRGYISTVFGCPYEGEVDFERVIELARFMLDLGANHVSLGDTTGMGEPAAVERKLVRIVDALGPERLALHTHDTRGVGLVNTLAALHTGIRIFDSSVGGLGGCPYAPGAAGNLASEDLVHLLDGLELTHDLDLESLVRISRSLAASGLEITSTFYRYALTLLDDVPNCSSDPAAA